jgi:hypothetical protein
VCKTASIEMAVFAIQLVADIGFGVAAGVGKDLPAQCDLLAEFVIGYRRFRRRFERANWLWRWGYGGWRM